MNYEDELARPVSRLTRIVLMVVGAVVAAGVPIAFEIILFG